MPTYPDRWGRLTFPRRILYKSPRTTRVSSRNWMHQVPHFFFPPTSADSREERNIEAYGIGTDAAGNIYVAGAVIGGSASDAFVLKIDFH